MSPAIKDRVRWTFFIPDFLYRVLSKNQLSWLTNSIQFHPVAPSGKSTYMHLLLLRVEVSFLFGICGKPHFEKVQANMSQDVSDLVASHHLSWDAPSQDENVSADIWLGPSGDFIHTRTAFQFKCTLCQLPPGSLTSMLHQKKNSVIKAFLQPQQDEPQEGIATTYVHTWPGDFPPLSCFPFTLVLDVFFPHGSPPFCAAVMEHLKPCN